MNHQPAANDPTMDLQQAADFLHLGYKAMKELVDSGDVPALSLNQKHTIMMREDLVAYVREQGRKQAEQRRNKRPPPEARPVRTRATRGAPTIKPDLSRYEATGERLK